MSNKLRMHVADVITVFVLIIVIVAVIVIPLTLATVIGQVHSTTPMKSEKEQFIEDCVKEHPDLYNDCVYAGQALFDHHVAD